MEAQASGPSGPYPSRRKGSSPALCNSPSPSRRNGLPRELEVLTAAAERCLRAADRARLLRDLADRETQLKALADHMLQVEEMERRRISRELHDDAGQSLVCIRLQLELTEGDIPEELVEVRRNLAGDSRT